MTLVKVRLRRKPKVAMWTKNVFVMLKQATVHVREAWSSHLQTRKESKKEQNEEYAAEMKLLPLQSPKNYKGMERARLSKICNSEICLNAQEQEKLLYEPHNSACFWRIHLSVSSDVCRTCQHKMNMVYRACAPSSSYSKGPVIHVHWTWQSTNACWNIWMQGSLCT